MLREVVSESGYAILQQVALVLFFAAFVAIVVWTLLRPRQEMERCARLPVENGSAAPPASSYPSVPQGETRPHE